MKDMQAMTTPARRALQIGLAALLLPLRPAAAITGSLPVAAR